MENKSVCAQKRRERDRSHKTRTQRMVPKRVRHGVTAWRENFGWR